ncbi:MAG: hypothetical protein OXM55_00135 [Bdellovibrionales bacterium]|nr:hypothetical protein [Bdellovibrionales bacterium]
MIKHFLFILLIPFFVSSQEQTEHAFSFKLESEGRLSKNQISRDQKQWHPYIPYTEIGLLYSKDDNLHFFINGELESHKNEWEIGLEELSLSYAFEMIPLSVKAGWFPIPLGYKGRNNNVFSQNLSFYKILAWSQEDIGAIADLYLWKKFLSLRVSYFGGWFYREQDGSYRAPDSAPVIISVRSKGFFWDAFASWFEKDLAFFDPLQAYGGGIHLHTSYKKLRVSLQSEFWGIIPNRSGSGTLQRFYSLKRKKRREGNLVPAETGIHPNGYKERKQTTFAYYIFPSIAIDKLKVGMVFGNINRYSARFKTAKAQSSLYERVFQISYQVHPNIRLIGERFISSQIKGYLTNDLWAARVKIHFDWSLQNELKSGW